MYAVSSGLFEMHTFMYNRILLVQARDKVSLLPIPYVIFSCAREVSYCSKNK